MITRIKFDSHEEWLSIRNKYIGGSDAGSVTGMNPYKGQIALWMEKTGKAKPFEGNITTEVGQQLEAFVATLFERNTGKKVRRVNATLVNDLYPFACANIDRRVVGENAILECKTTNSVPNMKLFRNGEFPESWYCQITHYMAVTGAEKAYLAVLVGCREFKLFTLNRDQDEIDALMAAEKEFWSHVENDTAPVPVSNADTKSLNATQSNSSSGIIDLTCELGLLRQYEAALAEEKEASDRVTAIRNQICTLLGEHEEGRALGYRIKWKPVTRNSFSAKLFQKSNPNIDLSPFYTTSTYRRFEFNKEA